jgi:hypothetical protein
LKLLAFCCYQGLQLSDLPKCGKYAGLFICQNPPPHLPPVKRGRICCAHAETPPLEGAS